MQNKKVIVITGGSDGLGKTMAKLLVKSHTVVILSPTKEKLEVAAKEVGAKFRVCDVRNFESCKSVLASIHKEFSKIDVLINSAGLWIQDELDDNDPEKIKELMDVNILGVIFMTKAVIPFMKDQKSGTIININSQGGFYAKPERSVYSAAKWGMTGFTKSLEGELSKYGIRVVGVYPGKMKTSMFSKMNIEKPLDDAIETEEVAKLVEFVINSKQTTNFPELGIKFLGN
jgi:NADP-dependent 3-hydroxy acid dehydrogenase YdfG